MHCKERFLSRWNHLDGYLTVPVILAAVSKDWSCLDKVNSICDSNHCKSWNYDVIPGTNLKFFTILDPRAIHTLKDSKLIKTITSNKLLDSVYLYIDRGLIFFLVN